MTGLTPTPVLEQALGALGTTFRLARLYPSTHPAAQESLRQVAAALPGLHALGTLEWRVGATGFHWRGQHLLPRNSQLGELAGLLFARGVRTIVCHPGLATDHVLALFAVATGNLEPDDPSLGRLALGVGRRSTQRFSGAAQPAEAAPSPPPAPVPSPPPEPVAAPVEAPPPAATIGRRSVAALRVATLAEDQRAAAQQLLDVVPQLIAQWDVLAVADVIAGLDDALPRLQDGEAAERIGSVAALFAEGPLVERLVQRLGEPRVAPAERSALIRAVGAMATVTAGPVVDAYLAAPAELREPYRAAMRVAADRALEPLQARLEDKNELLVAAAAHLLGLTGSPQAVPLLAPLTRHRAEDVREAALHAMAEIGGREVSRPAMPALKDDSPVVRAAAARAIGVGGDAGATTVLARRLEQEADEGVLAELLKAIGRLGAKEAVAVLARWADSGGSLKRRTPHVRAAAIEGLGHIKRPEARGLLELYRQDKEPTVKRAAEAALR